MTEHTLPLENAVLKEVVCLAPQMLYAQRAVVGGVPCVTFAFTGEPSTRVLRFRDEAECAPVWDEFIRIMTTHCNPACIVVGGGVLFQPAYLYRIMCHADERAHFIILDFGNERNVWIGYSFRTGQVAVYRALHEALGLEFKGVRNLKLVQ